MTFKFVTVPSLSVSLTVWQSSNAERLVLSHRTVQKHVQNTLHELQMHKRVELTRFAIQHGLDGE